MSDVPGMTQVQDWGNLMTSFGQGLASTNATNASASLTNAQTGLVGQQAQSAAMQNQIARARLPIVLKALQDYNQQTDDSGASAGGNGNGIQATPGTTGSPVPNPNTGGTAVPGQPAAAITPDNWYNKAQLYNGLRQAFFVDPTGTPQEKQAIYTASMSGDQGMLERAKMMRQNGVDSRLAQSQNNANEMYETMSNGVVNAPPGRALDALEAVSPQARAQAEKILAQFPNDPIDEDKAARAFASDLANTVHQYSGRKVVPNDDGTFRDETSGNVLTGSPQIGMKPDQLAQIASKGNELVAMKMSDGSEVQVPRYRAEGSQNLQAWLTKVASRANVQAAMPTVTGVPKAQFQAAARTAAANPAAAPSPAPPAPAAPNAPGAPVVTKAAPMTPPTAGVAAMQARMLPGADGNPINLDTLPKYTPAPPVMGRTPNPQEQMQIDAYKKNASAMYTDARQTLQSSNQADTLLAPLQQRLNTMNPRDVGPGSQAYKALLDAKTAITGKAPDDLVDMGVVDKLAAQFGVHNVRQLIGSGQRITNQEMMTLLTRASPSNTQPLDVMKTLVSYQKANNNFDRALANTQLMGLMRNVDPVALQGLENGRSAYVEQSMAKDGFGATTLGGGAVKNNPVSAATYTTPDAIKAAFQSGALTREQATQLLKTNHGMQ